MRTAEGILQKMIAEMPFELNYRMNPYIIEAMKIYAKQVSEQALNDASKKFYGIEMRDNFGCVCNVASAIESTKIELP